MFKQAAHSIADLAYAAGVIDSDGCVTVSRNKVSGSYRVSVHVSMVPPEVPLWFLKTFGGSYKQQYRREKEGKTYPDVHIWVLYCRNAADFLELIVPYLKLKKYRAEIAVELARRHSKLGSNQYKSYGSRRGIPPLSPVERQERTRLAEIIRSENLKSNPRTALIQRPNTVN